MAANATPTTTLVLGGGFGGLALCSSLRKLSPHSEGLHKIICIDKDDTFVIGATKHYVALGEKTLPEIHYYTAKGLAQQKCDFVKAEVLAIDMKNSQVITSQGPIKGDNLVIALGTVYDSSVVQGLKLDATSHEYYTPQGAERLKPALDAVKAGQHIVILIPRSPFKCPPAPYEFAMLLRDHFANKKKLDVKISVFTLEGAPMATAGPEAGAFMKGQLQANGVTFNGGKKTTSVDTESKKITFEDKSTTDYDLLIHIPPLAVPELLKSAGLTNGSGFIPANPQTLRVEHADSKFKAMWAVGDCTTVSLPGRFKPDMPLVLPKAGTIAHGAAQVVAQQIAKGASDPYSGEGFCYFETGGGAGFTANMNFYGMPNPTSRFVGPNKESLKEKLDWVNGIVEEFQLSTSPL